MSDSRAAARCYFNLNSQKASPFKRRGFFMAAARPTKNEELRTKNSRAAAPNLNFNFSSTFNFQKTLPLPRRVFLFLSLSLAPLRLCVSLYQAWMNASYRTSIFYLQVSAIGGCAGFPISKFNTINTGSKTPFPRNVYP